MTGAADLNQPPPLPLDRGELLGLAHIDSMIVAGIQGVWRSTGANQLLGRALISKKNRRKKLHYIKNTNITQQGRAILAECEAPAKAAPFADVLPAEINPDFVRDLVTTFILQRSWGRVDYLSSLAKYYGIIDENNRPTPRANDFVRYIVTDHPRLFDTLLRRAAERHAESKRRAAEQHAELKQEIAPLLNPIEKGSLNFVIDQLHPDVVALIRDLT